MSNWFMHHIWRLMALVVFGVWLVVGINHLGDKLPAKIYDKGDILLFFTITGVAFWYGWRSGKERAHEELDELAEQAQREESKIYD